MTFDFQTELLFQLLNFLILTDDLFVLILNNIFENQNSSCILYNNYNIIYTLIYYYLIT